MADTCTPWCIIKCYTADQKDFIIKFPNKITLENLNSYVQEKYGPSYRCYMLKHGTLKRLRKDSEFQTLVRTHPEAVDIYIKLSRTLSRSENATPTVPNLEFQQLIDRTSNEPHINSCEFVNERSKPAWRPSHRRCKSDHGVSHRPLLSSYIPEIPTSPTFELHQRFPSASSTYKAVRFDNGGCFVPDNNNAQRDDTPDSGIQSPDMFFYESPGRLQLSHSPNNSNISITPVSTPSAWDCSDMPRHLLEEIPLHMEDLTHKVDKLILPNTVHHSKSSELKYDVEELEYPKNVQISDLIGQGGFAKVFHCVDLDTGRDLALKQIEYDPKCSDSENELRALKNEIQILKKLKHPHIVRYFGSNCLNGKFDIFMEYISGGSLRHYIQKNGPLSIKLTIKSVSHMLLGLAYLHNAHIIHRDLKAANVLKDSTGTIKLADFGSSKRLETLRNKTAAKTVVGTPYWMAPEVIKSQGSYDNKVDVWGIGATTLEFLTSKPPFFQYEPMAAMFKIASTQLKDELKFSENTPDSLKMFILSCLEYKPENRPTVDELLSLILFENYI